jgi:hypothetical protein
MFGITEITTKKLFRDSGLKFHLFDFQGVSMRQLRGRDQCDSDGDWLPKARGSRGRPATAAGAGQALLRRSAASGLRR